jgi:hypothetical protein
MWPFALLAAAAAYVLYTKPSSATSSTTASAAQASAAQANAIALSQQSLAGPGGLTWAQFTQAASTLGMQPADIQNAWQQGMTPEQYADAGLIGSTATTQGNLLEWYGF